MVGVEVGIISVLTILVLIYAGVHVAVALGLVSFVGVWIYKGSVEIAISLLAEATHDTIAHEVASMLGRIKRGGFDLHMEGLDSFGGRKPRAVVAKVTPAQGLMEVQAEQERLMQRIGLEPEGRKFMPHVTLARLRDSSSRQVAEYLAARGLFRTSPFRVSRFVLYSSRSSVGGGPYVIEEAYPLGT